MYSYRRAVGHGPVHGDLELARQVAELGIERRPLPDDFAPDEGVDNLVVRHAREVVGGDVADAVARGLDGVHLHARQLGEDVGDLLEAGPVELQVLARREMPVGTVVLARDVGELSQLSRRKQPVGNRDAQHRRVALDVKAVTQPQRAEIVLAQLAGEEAPRLVAELLHALVYDALIYFVVKVHAGPGL